MPYFALELANAFTDETGDPDPEFATQTILLGGQHLADEGFPGQWSRFA